MFVKVYFNLICMILCFDSEWCCGCGVVYIYLIMYFVNVSFDFLSSIVFYVFGFFCFVVWLLVFDLVDVGSGKV